MKNKLFLALIVIFSSSTALQAQSNTPLEMGMVSNYHQLDGSGNIITDPTQMDIWTVDIGFRFRVGFRYLVTVRSVDWEGVVSVTTSTVSTPVGGGGSNFFGQTTVLSSVVPIKEVIVDISLLSGSGGPWRFTYHTGISQSDFYGPNRVYSGTWFDSGDSDIVSTTMNGSISLWPPL